MACHIGGIRLNLKDVLNMLSLVFVSEAHQHALQAETQQFCCSVVGAFGGGGRPFVPNPTSGPFQSSTSGGWDIDRSTRPAAPPTASPGGWALSG